MRARAAQLAPNTAQLAGRRVAHAARIIDGVRDCLLQPLQRHQRLRQFRQQRPEITLLEHDAAHFARCAQQLRQLIELAAIERGAGHGGLANGRNHVRNAWHAPLLGANQQCDHLIHAL